MARALAEDGLDGLLVSVAGPTDEGVRIIWIWRSEQAWQGFSSDRLEPALAAVGTRLLVAPVLRAFEPGLVVTPPGPAPPQPRRRR